MSGTAATGATPPTTQEQMEKLMARITAEVHEFGDPKADAGPTLSDMMLAARNDPDREELPTSITDYVVGASGANASKRVNNAETMLKNERLEVVRVRNELNTAKAVMQNLIDNGQAPSDD